MKVARLAGILVAALVLCGCYAHVKVPKHGAVTFDRAIKCPTFEASGVAVMRADQNTYLVIDRDGQQALVNDLGCVVAGGH